MIQNLFQKVYECFQKVILKYKINETKNLFLERLKQNADEMSIRNLFR